MKNNSPPLLSTWEPIAATPSQGSNKFLVDFGDANFPLSWTTGETVPSPLWIFSQLQGGHGEFLHRPGEVDSGQEFSLKTLLGNLIAFLEIEPFKSLQAFFDSLFPFPAPWVRVALP